MPEKGKEGKGICINEYYRDCIAMGGYDGPKFHTVHCGFGKGTHWQLAKGKGIRIRTRNA